MISHGRPSAQKPSPVLAGKAFSGAATVPQPVTDVAQTLAALKKLADKRFGSNEDAKRRALTADFGREISDLILQ